VTRIRYFRINILKGWNGYNYVEEEMRKVSPYTLTEYSNCYSNNLRDVLRMDDLPIWRMGYTPTIFIASFSTSEDIERRKMIRSHYQKVLSRYPNVSFKFVIGNDTRFTREMEEENNINGDIMTIDCTENMNDGKTWYFMNAVHKEPFEFVLKVDYDAVVIIPNLIDAVRSFQGKKEVYYGRKAAHTVPYMQGMGYMLSIDLVKYIANSAEAFDMRKGHEDMQVGDMLQRRQPPIKNMIHEGEWIHNAPGTQYPTLQRPLGRHTIIIHGMKDTNMWTDTFNQAYQQS